MINLPQEVESKFAKETTIKVTVTHKVPTRREATGLRSCFVEFFKDMEIPQDDYKIDTIKH